MKRRHLETMYDTLAAEQRQRAAAASMASAWVLTSLGTSDPGAAPTARGLASTSVEGADDDGR